MITQICITGAGTMGMGIAMTAAQNGFQTILFDINSDVVEKARQQIGANLASLIEKKKITVEEQTAVLSRILFTSRLDECRANLVIEAIVEKIAVKEDLFKKLAAINSPETLLASNTSSLSISEIQKNIPSPERVAGMHFFNPAHIMKLVEVVKGKLTSDDTANRIADLCRQLNKTPVLCNDAPGFIVNRVARHYYLEALHLVETGKISIEQADAAMENAGFKMGPFKLMDMIGMDINLAVTTSLYEAFDKAVRFKPSDLQTEKVAKNELGKKTGKGFYIYP
ncbi:MAG: 3-hydroxyacyl-CoA dehydrogenase NAD-binding domain-containing protein [Ferruginibacter sp.]